MTHRIIISLIAIASIVQACSSKINQTTPDGEKLIDFACISYDDMISFIVEGYQCNWSFDTEPQIYGLSNIYCCSSPYAGFIKMDINGDGIEDLIFGENMPDEPTVIYDIMTIDTRDWSLCHLASGGERDRFYLTESGLVVEQGSNSAENSFEKVYRIKRRSLKETSGPADKFRTLQLDPFIKYAHHQLCGGFTEEREIQPDELEMFRSIITDPAINPQTVATQVVAGINYRFRCLTPDGEVMITIYRNLQGELQLLEQ